MAGKRIAVFSLLALAGLGLALFASSGTEAQTYKASLDYSLADTAGGAASDSYNTIRVPAPDLNYEDSSMFSFVPSAGVSVSGPERGLGSAVGVLSSEATVGVANNPCATGLPPVFNLYNASIDTSDELGPSQMNWLLKDKDNVPVPYEGYTGPNGDDPQLPDYLEGYPQFLNELLDVDGPTGDDPPLQPRARYAGHDFVAGNNILIQFLVFSPGQLSALESVRGITGQMTSAMGSPTLIVLNNPISQAEAPGTITDFCTPLKTTTTLYPTTGDNPRTGAINDGCPRVGNYDDCDANCNGNCTDPGEDELCGLDRYDDDTCDAAEPSLARTINDGCPPVGGSEAGSLECGNDLNDDGDAPVEGGDASQSNPPADSGILGTGTHIARNYSQSERDADGDGFENDLDPCPYTVDPGWDPTAPDTTDGTCIPGWVGDSDCDGLPNSCDPDPAGSPTDPDNIDCIGAQNDCDDDGYKNCQDICPLVPNGLSEDNMADDDSSVPNDDLGPSPDSIGNVCDDSDCDGVEDGVNPLVYPCSCADGLDNGGDDVIDGNDPDCQPYMDSQDSDPWGASPGTGQFFHSMPWSAVCVGPAGSDDDGDGYCDATETTLGSDATVTGGSEYDLDEPTYCSGDGNCCENATDDDGDTYVNDGCPQVGNFAESDAECAIGDNDSDDTTGDLCPPDGSSPGPDCLEEAMGEAVNDGCPVIGVPESLVIDVQISAPSAKPLAAVAQSCNDGVDNDGDGTCDGIADFCWAGSTPDAGCLTGSYTGDDDYDGEDDASTDNCGTGNLAWNPEQTNTDQDLDDGGASVTGDALGDACDDDDDNDLYDDDLEWYLGTDPRDNCPNTVGKHDAWPLDISMDTIVTVSGDVLKYRGNIQVSVSSNPPTSWALRRLDLNGDGIITVSGDVLKFRGMIQVPCL